MPQSVQSRAVTLAIASAGAAIFYIVNLPLPFLLGPLAACLLAALAGAPMKDMGPVGTAMRAILGVAVGASVTPELFGRLSDMALSVALVPVFVLIVAVVGYPFFRRICNFDPVTSYYCAMPGGLQDMLVFGSEAGGDVRALSLIHATRVLVIVTTAPLLLSTLWGLPLTNAPGQAAANIPLMEILLMVGAGVVGWWAASRVGLFGASILGPLIATAALSLSDQIHHRPPAEAIICAQFFIGLTVGVKYTGITWGELRKDVSAGVAFCVILAAISLVFAKIVTSAGIAPPVDALLAFSPGGQAEMAVLAIVAGADIAFVVTHHLTRMIVVITGAPLFFQMMQRRRHVAESKLTRHDK